jgi:nicotinate-nucleotide adenylyltransferase
MIGIFGGSFDPIHNGHIAMAMQAQQQLQLSQVFFVPCKIHAFGKNFHTTDRERLAMLNLALADYPSFHIDERELHDSDASYTYRTVLSFQQEYPQEKFALLLGMDAAAQFERWHEWRKLLSMVTLVVLQRSGAGSAVPLAIKNLASKDEVVVLNNPVVDIASTQIRQQLLAQENISKLVPTAVLNYINQHHLYQKEA